MLDNRSNTTITILIDKKSYVVAGLDYAIVTLANRCCRYTVKWNATAPKTLPRC